MTGLGVALGPISGGWLLEHFWWGSVFVAMAPVAAVTFLSAALFVPTSGDPATPPVDVVGLVLSTLAIGTLVYTIIEAPERGWTDPATTGGFALAAAAAAVVVAWERGRPHPMLDVSLFRNLRLPGRLESAARGHRTRNRSNPVLARTRISVDFQQRRRPSPVDAATVASPPSTCAFGAVDGAP
jgi:MFS family permease